MGEGGSDGSLSTKKEEEKNMDQYHTEFNAKQHTPTTDLLHTKLEE